MKRKLHNTSARLSKINSLPLAVLVSGNGTNLQAIINAAKAPRFPAQVKLVISDQPKAKALKRAKKNAIPTAVIRRESFANKEEFETAILKELQSHQVKLVCLAGFMRIVGPTLLNAFPNRILNIHPALLPAFPGLEAQRQALEHGVKIAGCTVHLVDQNLDQGPIILQAAVPVLDSDTVETLKNRILEKEHQIYPEALRLLAEGKLKIQGRKTIIKRRSL